MSELKPRSHAAANVPIEDLRALRELAKQNERSVSAEIRIAIRAHLTANGKEAS